VAVHRGPQSLLARAVGAAPPVAEGKPVEYQESSVKTERAQAGRLAPFSCLDTRNSLSICPKVWYNVHRRFPGEASPWQGNIP